MEKGGPHKSSDKCFSKREITVSNAAEKSYKIMTEIIHYISILQLNLFEELLGWIGGDDSLSRKV